jgi:hypothetical protein
VGARPSPIAVVPLAETLIDRIAARSPIRKLLFIELATIDAHRSVPITSPISFYKT